MNKFNQHPHPCVRCLYPTAPGYGRFVNRVPGDYELEHDDGTIEYRDGYHCAWCLSPECDRCGKTILMDEEIRRFDLYSEEPDDLDDEFEDGSFNVHAECLTPAEIETMQENNKGLYRARKDEFTQHQKNRLKQLD